MADISSQLSALGNAYNSAMASGNTGAAQQAHDQANALRQSAGQATYYDSNFDSGASAQNQSSVSTSNPGTGTTGTTSGGLASQMLQAAQSPSYTGQTTTWNNGQGNTLKTPVYNGRSISSMSDLASSLGVNYTKDPSTGAITVNGKSVNPVGYDQSGNPIVQVRQVLNAMGVPDEQIQYDQKTGNVSYTAPQQSGAAVNPYQVPYMQQQPAAQVPYMQPYQIPNYMPQLMNAMPSMPSLQAYQAPDTSSLQNQLMQYQQFNPNWNSYYNQAHQQFDPTTNQQVNDLMTKQRTDITSSDEKMNQRGIFNSGIAQAVEDDIRAKTSDSIAKVFTAAQSNIAKVAQQLYTDAFDQYYKGNDLALKNNQMILTQINDQQKQSFSNWLSTQQLSLSQYNYAMNAWDHMSTLIQNDAKMSMDNSQFYSKENSAIAQFNAKSATDNSQFFDKLNQQTATDNANNAMKMYQFNNLSADQSATLAQKQYQFNNLSADQKAQLAWDGYKFNNLSADQSANLQQKQYQFNNLSAEQKSQLAWDQYKFGNLSADQSAQNSIQQDNLKLKMMDMMGYDTQGNPTLNRQKFDETTQYHQQLIDDAHANITNNENKTAIDAISHQLTTSDSQMKNLIAGGATPDNPMYKALAKQSDDLAKQLESYKGTYGGSGFPGQ